jgi:hypothetical protein
LIYKGDFASVCYTTLYIYRFVTNKPLIYKDKSVVTHGTGKMSNLKLIIGNLKFKVLSSNF